MKNRRNQYDVTNDVRLAHPFDVCRSIRNIFTALYPDTSFSPIADAFIIFTEMFTGRHPDYFGCDTWYHDTQHSLDTALATIRLIDGHERGCRPADRLGGRRGTLAVIIALFHDMGYLRRKDDDADNGAVFTQSHVERGADFLETYLPSIAFQDEVEVSREIIHYTGFERPLDALQTIHPHDRKLGYFIGTADLLAQMSDRCYLEKCRDFLFHEFEICGFAANDENSLYTSPEDLLSKTPGFNEMIWDQRLDGFFEGAYRNLDRHFGGRNPYVSEIEAHMDHLKRVLDIGDFRLLRREPPCIQASELSHIIEGPGTAALLAVN